MCSFAFISVQFFLFCFTSICFFLSFSLSFSFFFLFIVFDDVRVMQFERHMESNIIRWLCAIDWLSFYTFRFNYDADVIRNNERLTRKIKLRDLYRIFFDFNWHQTNQKRTTKENARVVCAFAKSINVRWNQIAKLLTICRSKDFENVTVNSSQSICVRFFDAWCTQRRNYPMWCLWNHRNKTLNNLQTNCNAYEFLNLIFLFTFDVCIYPRRIKSTTARKTKLLSFQFIMFPFLFSIR